MMTHPAGNRPAPTPATHSRGSTGFSLVETIMMLGIISMVVIPALMLMDRQGEFLTEQNRIDMVDVYANTLFGNVDLDHPRVTTVYNQATRQSVHCDPAGKTQPASAFSGGVCDTGGADIDRPPFFTRTVDYLAPVGNADGTQAISVAINIFDAASGGTARYSETRYYEVDAFHISFGQNYSSAVTPLVATPLGTSNTEVQADAGGTNWMPAHESTTNGGATQIAYLYHTYDNGCTPTHASMTATRPNDAPYTRVASLSGCPANVDSYNTRFRVQNNTMYRVTVFFNSGTSTTSTACMANTSGMSCHLGSIEIRSYAISGAAYASATLLAEDDVFDVVAATNEQINHGVSKTFLVQTPANTDMLEIAVRTADNTIATSGTVVANLAGIEVIRRDDLHE
ncbi:MAG: hypothetical protein KC475_01530 [Cyanobacteria bacterium HKST-UBA03]|nr:hypothetical protein [Cyanobacteria bacterium HKST-UBA03]